MIAKSLAAFLFLSLPLQAKTSIETAYESGELDLATALAAPDGKGWGPGLVLVMGSEDKGLRQRVAECCDQLVRIPMTDTVESLNVSNAAAIALYEAAKWRPVRDETPSA